MTDMEQWYTEEEWRAARRAKRRQQQRRRRRRNIQILLFIILIEAIFFIGLLLKFLAGLISSSTYVNAGGNPAAETETETGELTEAAKTGTETGKLTKASDTGTKLRVTDPPEITADLLPINEYSRPGDALTEVNGIVVHYTGNPGTTAAQNRSYFASLAETGEASASSHFVIGLEGEIIQCVPCDEIAYASNDRNCDTLSIECCIEDESGIFNDATYQSLIKLVAWLMGQYDLDTDDVIRHYDVTGKLCPKYYAENPEAWEAFKEDLEGYIEEYGT